MSIELTLVRLWRSFTQIGGKCRESVDAWRSWLFAACNRLGAIDQKSRGHLPLELLCASNEPTLVRLWRSLTQLDGKCRRFVDK